MRRECERLWEVDALREGRLAPRDVESFARHRQSCEVCRDRFEEDERLSLLGRALPSPEVDSLRARRLRLSILRAAATREVSSRSPWSGAMAFGILGVCVALFVLLVVWRSHPRSTVLSTSATSASNTTVPMAQGDRPFGAVVDAEPGAVWDARTEGLVERVELSSGAITLTVRHRERGERFVVDVPDGEIEVRGTRFRVEVRVASTRSVRVFEGLVALRRRGAPEVSLAAGESWSPIEAKPEAERPARDGAPTLAPSLASSASTREGASARAVPSRSGAPRESAAEDDSEYEAAVALFTANRYDEAARAFHAFATAHSDRAFADDAAFLEASALARGGRGDAASIVAERFLDRYPGSIHVSDAASLVVRAARDRHDCGRARTFAAKWIPEPIARASALGVCVDPERE